MEGKKWREGLAVMGCTTQIPRIIITVIFIQTHLSEKSVPSAPVMTAFNTVTAAELQI
jgi:hypothetical protein